MDAPTLKKFKNLSDAAVQTLFAACVVYPETESIQKDIDRAATLHTKIEYKSLTIDLDQIIAMINSNPRFLQLHSKVMCIELLRSLAKVRDLEEMLVHVDYIVFHRMKLPLLCLENKNDSVKIGISAFIEVTEVGMKVRETTKRDWLTKYCLGISFIFSGIMISRANLPLRVNTLGY